MIAIAGYLDFESETARDAVVRASAELQAATRSTERGCIAYVFAADPVEPQRVQVYELWSDEASLRAHFESDLYGSMRSVLRSEQRVDTCIRKHRIDLSQPVYDASGTARAEFFVSAGTE